ncbi:MAG: leucine-rich repeat domain-containing protein [Clostridiales bacterium]|nr:leucine-rich repeat domain-containing protein [Clostridiales bacterium]
MKKTALLLLLLVLLTGAAQAESAMRSVGGLSFPADATAVDLEDLELSMDELTAFLDGFSNLERVDMFGTKVTKKEIEMLVARYPNVKFGWTIHIFGKGRGHDVRTDQTAFSTLHGDCYEHTSQQMEVLRYCTELRALDLGHNLLRDISFLKDLTKLRVLILGANEITDISPLAGMQDLEYLELFSNHVSDLSPLLNMPRLMDLNIVYNRVPDMEILMQLKGLRRLWTGHCIKGLTGSGPMVEQLRQALPDTLVVAEGEPTQNGWRDDPHYDVIQEMFQKGVYIPFAESPPLEEE